MSETKTEAREAVWLVSPHQHKILASNKRLILAGMGIGAGKTHTGTGKVLQWAADSPPGVSHIIAANSYTQLFDSTLAGLYKNLTELGVMFRPRRLPETPSSYGPWNLMVWQGEHWVTFRCRSLSKYQLISGQEAGCAWIDEAWDSEEAAYQVVGDRVRDKRMPYNQRLVTSTLDDIDSWMHKVFVDNFRPERDEQPDSTWRWAESDSVLVVYASTAANAKHLPEHYIDDRLSDYTDLEANRMIGSGEDHRSPPTWGSRTATIYHSYDRSLHVDPAADFDEMFPTIWSHDFNIADGAPISSVLQQKKPGTFEGRRRPELHTFDEIVMDTADTRDVIDEFFSRWGDKIDPGTVTITGDASGRARDTRSKTSDYDLLRDAGFVVQNVPRSNPPLRTRHNRSNAMLKSARGDVRARIHPRCRTLDRGLATTRLKPGARYIELETREQHVTTAWSYAVMSELPPETSGKAAGSMRR